MHFTIIVSEMRGLASFLNAEGQQVGIQELTSLCSGDNKPTSDASNALREIVAMLPQWLVEHKAIHGKRAMYHLWNNLIVVAACFVNPDSITKIMLQQDDSPIESYAAGKSAQSCKVITRTLRELLNK